jgi:hypothetical protein
MEMSCSPESKMLYFGVEGVIRGEGKSQRTGVA